MTVIAIVIGWLTLAGILDDTYGHRIYSTKCWAVIAVIGRCIEVLLIITFVAAVVVSMSMGSPPEALEIGR